MFSIFISQLLHPLNAFLILYSIRPSVYNSSIHILSKNKQFVVKNQVFVIKEEARFNQI